ncbi:3760_t:CDS:2 [Entrophospora sp. SA101]|nr:3760_t:CDS:2 [Entrophospora sp. SA101]
MSSISFKSDYRRQKDLEAARKAGTAPAEQDEEGKDINPHIPQYIAKAPWYLDTGGPSLKHQRIIQSNNETEMVNDRWYARGVRAGPAAKKYRKGACENCGAMTHKSRDCMDRPRKTGAKWSGTDIKAYIELDYDAKRDRWNGYDPSEHVKIYEEYEKIEDERRKIKANELDKQSTTELVKKTGKRTADPAKYLRNLDINSAHYDPKTRSMRDNPNKEIEPDDATYEKGTDVHLQANPTQGELLYHEFLQKKEKLKDSSKESILAKYGGEEHLDTPPKELLLAQSETYVEYSRTGRIIKGQERAKAKSRYEEDGK